MWRTATPEEAWKLTERLKAMGVLSRAWGTFNADHLQVCAHETEGIVGAFYAIPDSLYTVVAEVWMLRPELCIGLRALMHTMGEDMGGHPVLLAYFDVARTRWIRTIETLGGRYSKTCVQLDLDTEDMP